MTENNRFLDVFYKVTKHMICKELNQNKSIKSARIAIKQICMKI